MVLILNNTEIGAGSLKNLARSQTAVEYGTEDKSFNGLPASRRSLSVTVREKTIFMSLQAGYKHKVIRELCKRIL